MTNMDKQDKQKLIWPIAKVFPWEKNPRDIKPEEFEKLKKKIQKFGQFKPLIVTTKGEILGGNMRYKAYKELGIDNVWVSVVEPKDETEKLEISLADNEAAGFYVQDDLAELIKTSDIDRDLYTISLDQGKTLDDFIGLYNPIDPTPVDQEVEDVPEVMIEIKTTKNVYLKIKETLDEWEEDYGIEYNVS